MLGKIRLQTRSYPRMQALLGPRPLLTWTVLSVRSLPHLRNLAAYFPESGEGCRFVVWDRPLVAGTGYPSCVFQAR